VNIATLLIFLFQILIIYGSYQYHLIGQGKAFYFNKLKWKTQISRVKYLEIDKVLKKRISFYTYLDDDNKAKFIHRLCLLLHKKKFVSKKGLQLTTEIKIVACSAIVQVTFGLRSYELANIKGFNIYPTVFYNSFMKAYLKGSSPPDGMLSLSWKDLAHGFLVDNDKYNLGLHEVAHSLKSSLKYADDFDTGYFAYIKKWEAVGHVEFKKMQRGEASFLREYAGVNEHEFFAVCIEHFFEVPEQFQYNLPDIFYHLSVLLNLDPLNQSGNYKVVKQGL
jgi:Mlc titration factor MtfA (ptsG expression regulator)